MCHGLQSGYNLCLHLFYSEVIAGNKGQKKTKTIIVTHYSPSTDCQRIRFGCLANSANMRLDCIPTIDGSTSPANENKVKSWEGETNLEREIG